MRVVVHSAAIQDRGGAGLVLDKIRRRFPWLELIWADGGYNAWKVDAAVAKVPPLRMEIVKRSDDIKSFVVLPRRWVVERTFSWFGRNRRLAKENLTETLATFVTLASIQLALRRARQGVGSDDGGLQSVVKRPSPGRPATTGTRRFRTFQPRPGTGRFDPEPPLLTAPPGEPLRRKADDQVPCVQRVTICA
jgi:transposase